MRRSDNKENYFDMEECTCIKNDRKPAEETIGKHYSLLVTIGVRLGLTEKDSVAIADDICAVGERRFNDQPEGLSLRLWLSKRTIHSCIFKISSRLFSQTDLASDINLDFRETTVPRSIRGIPLSFRTIYILVYGIGFTQKEVSQLLNITPLQVKERLAKATSRIATV